MTTDPLDDFYTYAVAFETGYERDDWDVVRELLTDDIVWSVSGASAPVDGARFGPDECIAAIEESVNTFDRRFTTRIPHATVGPTAIPGGIHMEFEVTYRQAGIPDFVLRGEEWDIFRDGRLAMHHERIHNVSAALAHLDRHDTALVPRRTPRYGSEIGTE